MAEMAVRIGAGRDQHIAAVLDPLHRPLDGAEMRRVGVVLGVVDQHHLGLDLVEIGLGVVVHDRLDRPKLVVGVAPGRLFQPLFVERVGRRQGRRHLLDAGRALDVEIAGGAVDVVARILVVEAVVPVRIVADRLGGGAAAEPVAAADLDRLARDRDDPVHQVGIGLGPHPGMHAAHRAADDEAQVADPEVLGDEAIAAVDHVAVAVVREVAAEAVGRLRRAAAADRILHDDEVVAGIERLARPEQFVGELGPQPVGAGAGIALQQEHAVDDPAGGVALRHADRAIVQFQLGQHLAAGETVVLQDEIGLVVVRPLGRHGGAPVAVRP